jgi:hypothetical protein
MIDLFDVLFQDCMTKLTSIIHKDLALHYGVVYSFLVITRGRIFSCVRPFYERAVSDLGP